MQASLVLDAGMTIEGSTEKTEEGSFRWTGGILRCTAAEYGFELDGGRIDHRQGRVGDTRLSRGASVVLINLLTPFEHEIRIRPFKIDSEHVIGAGTEGKCASAF